MKYTDATTMESIFSNAAEHTEVEGGNPRPGAPRHNQFHAIRFEGGTWENGWDVINGFRNKFGESKIDID